MTQKDNKQLLFSLMHNIDLMLMEEADILNLELGVIEVNLR